MKKLFLSCFFILPLLLMNSCFFKTATIAQKAYEPLLKGQPLSHEELSNIKSSFAKDAVFADLLQAFALLRTEDLNKEFIRKEVINLLSSSVASFENMQDPENFSVAFSADESKSFTGLPHERMFASTMLGVLLMAEGKYAQALPHLKNAEFLDARFQKLPFGTDAPLIYTLMLRCLHHEKANKDQMEHAKDGIFRSIRFLELQKPLLKLMVNIAKSDIRNNSASINLAYLLMEISLYHSLISMPNKANVVEIIENASRQAEIFLSVFQNNFADEYEEKIFPVIKNQALVLQISKKERDYFSKNVLQKSFFEVSLIAKKMKDAYLHINHYQKNIDHAQQKIDSIYNEAYEFALAKKMVVNFSGKGPTLERQGQYKEIAVIKTSPDGSDDPQIRKKSILTQSSCGFHRQSKQGLAVVLCDNNGFGENGEIKNVPSLEFLSLSRKAKMIGGRSFDKILKGRAKFRSATEDVAHVSIISAFFLFHMGIAMIDDCQKRGAPEACYTAGFALLAAGGITAVFSGTVWLIGASINPSADSRYIPLMYESSYIGKI